MRKKPNTVHSSSGRMMYKFQKRNLNHPTRNNHHDKRYLVNPKELDNKNDDHAPSVLDQRTHAALFFMAFAWQLQKAFAENLYTFDTKEGIHYLINYTKNEFPHLEQLLVEHCKTLLFYDLAQTNYTNIDAPHCERHIDDPQPGISLGVAVGNNITASFALCLNNAMLSACKVYYQKYDERFKNEDTTSLWVILGVAFGMICCVGIGAFTLNVISKNEARDQSTPTQSESSDTYVNVPVTRNNYPYAFYAQSAQVYESSQHHSDSGHHHQDSHQADDVTVHWGPSHH